MYSYATGYSSQKFQVYICLELWIGNKMTLSKEDRSSTYFPIDNLVPVGKRKQLSEISYIAEEEWKFTLHDITSTISEDCINVSLFSSYTWQTMVDFRSTTRSHMSQKHKSRSNMVILLTVSSTVHITCYQVERWR